MQGATIRGERSLRATLRQGAARQLGTGATDDEIEELAKRLYRLKAGGSRLPKRRQNELRLGNPGRRDAVRRGRRRRLDRLNRRWRPGMARTARSPGHRQGETVDTNVETIDILPTLAVALGVRLPWTTDGANVLDPAWSGRPAKTMLVAGGGTRRMAGPADPSSTRRIRDEGGSGPSVRTRHRGELRRCLTSRSFVSSTRPLTASRVRLANCDRRSRYPPTMNCGTQHLAECARRSGGREAPRQHPWAAATTESPRGGRSRPDWPSDRIGELKRGP